MDVLKFKDIFKQIILNLKLCGIPADGSSLGLRFHLPAWLTIILMLIEEISFFISKASSDNFLVLTALAPCIVNGALSVAKISVIALKRRQIFKLIDSLDELYNDILLDDVKKSLVIPNALLLKNMTKYYFILNAILISVYNYSSLIFMLYDYITKGDVNYLLPYAVIVPFSTDSLMNWLIVYLHSCVSGFVCVLYYTTVDALYYNLSWQVCSNFAVISHELENLAPVNAHSLIDIVKRHQLLLELSNLLEDIFAAPNLFNMLVGSVEICALGFNIMAGDWSVMPGCILFLLSIILQILLMSVFGDNLIRESSGVGNAAWHGKWLEMEPKYKKLILIIMIRSQKPQILTAYKFSTIGYGSFTKIISTSWSYFTILKTVYKPKN